MTLKALQIVSVAALSLAVSGSAATPVIGVATAAGTFNVNSADVEGNANVFDGSQVRTGQAASQVFLQNGSAVTLGADSSGTIYRDHMLLQQGAAKVNDMTGFSIRTGSYRVESNEPRSQAVVRLEGGDVQIAALTGSLNVLNGRGALLTRVGAGTASSFRKDPQSDEHGGPPANTANRPKEASLYLLLIGSLAGLGLATDAILQPGTKHPTSN